MLSTSLLILDVDLGHLVQAVFVTFLHWKITLSISYSWSHVVIPWGWCIYINHLEFFFMGNLSILCIYFFIPTYVCVCVVCVMCVCTYQLSCIRLFVTPWSVAGQAPLSMGFPREEYWSGLPFPTSGELSNPEIKSTSPASPTVVGRFFTSEPPGKSNVSVQTYLYFKS